MPTGSSTIGRLVYLISGDSSALTKELTKSERLIKRAAANFQKVGENLTRFVTVPAAALGTLFVKAAIDAEETAAKFGTAFRDVSDKANDAAASLASGYGLAQTEAQRLLASTGDLLKGFGATGGQALDLSNTVQELAVDLASYNNLQGGASRASEILTKALLGEREGLTAVGIKISEADVKARLLQKGQQDLEGRTLLLAKAQATLELAMQQSGDALGDFARTADSPANQLKILKARAEDVATTIGKDLLPIAVDLISWAKDIVEYFAAMDEEQRKTILRIIGVAAAIGPLLIVGGRLTKTITNISAALKLGTTGFSAYALAATAVIGATAALVAWNNRIREARENQDKLLESTLNLTNVTNELTRAQATAQIKIMTTALGDQNQLLTRNTRSLSAARARLADLETQIKTAAPGLVRQLVPALEGAHGQVAIMEQKVAATTQRVAELNAGLREQTETLKAYEVATRETAAVVAETSEQRIDYQERIAAAEDAEAALNRVLADATIARVTAETEAIDHQARAVEALQARYESAAASIFSQVAPAMMALGQAIVEGSAGWEAFKDAALDAIAGVLQALAKEFAIRAAAALVPLPGLFNPGAAAGLAALSAAALVAAGVIRSLDTGGEFITHGRELVMVGDNPGGVEKVTATPMSSSASDAGIPIENHIHLPEGVLFSAITRGFRKRKILTPSGSVTP